jgi:hypothetical protein
MQIDSKCLLEAFARVLGEHAKYHSSEAAMLVCNLGTDLRNFMSDADVTFLFDAFMQAKNRGENHVI